MVVDLDHLKARHFKTLTIGRNQLELVLHLFLKVISSLLIKLSIQEYLELTSLLYLQ